MHNFAKIRTLCINCLWQTTHPFVCSWNGVSDLEEKEERKWEGNKLEREIIEIKEERGKNMNIICFMCQIVADCIEK